MRAALAHAFRSAAGCMYLASDFLTGLAGKTLILMYHRVIPSGRVPLAFVQPGMYVTANTFERHVRYLADRFECVTFREWLSLSDSGRWSDSTRYCIVTFDDGWLDTYEHAYPLLRRYGVPATIFLPTGLVGSTEAFWPDRLGDLLQWRGLGTPHDWNASIERAKELGDQERETLIERLAADVGDHGPVSRRLVNWQEVREMSRHGMAFGSHSITHANLTRLEPAALERELRGSLETLRAHDGVNWVPVLAYPNGDHTDDVAAAARSAGYRAAVTTRGGVEAPRLSDPFRLKRIALHDDVSRSIPVMAFQIARGAARWQG